MLVCWRIWTSKVRSEGRCSGWVVMLGESEWSWIGIMRGLSQEIRFMTTSVANSLQPHDCSLPGSSVLGVSQARILEWVAISFSKGPSQRMYMCAQSCPTLCDPTDCSPPGSPVHGIFQANILEWVAIYFSRNNKSFIIGWVAFSFFRKINLLLNSNSHLDLSTSLSFPHTLCCFSRIHLLIYLMKTQNI